MYPHPGYTWHVFDVVTGAPASGKTTVSKLLADELRLTRLAKDTIKFGLLKVLSAGDVQASRLIGAAAVQALLAVAAENKACVLDSVWVREDSVEALRRLPGPMVEVFCACEPQELQRRYRERASQRQGRDYDFDMARPEAELWNDRSLRPLAGGWPVLTINTQVPVDIPALASSVLAAVAPTA